VHGAAAGDQIVLANGIAGHNLDEPADALERPSATTTLLMTVRVSVPGTGTNTMLPLTVSPVKTSSAALTCDPVPM